nr:putative purine permease 10 [Quercus suber]
MDCYDGIKSDNCRRSYSESRQCHMLSRSPCLSSFGNSLEEVRGCAMLFVNLQWQWQWQLISKRANSGAKTLAHYAFCIEEMKQSLLVRIAGLPQNTCPEYEPKPQTLLAANFCFLHCSQQHDVFSWALAPSSIYFCTYLRIPVDLQCFLLLTYKFTEVYSFYNQFSSPSDHLLCPAGISNQSTKPTGNSNVNYEIRLFCTVGASAGYGLMLSLTQISFHKVLRRETFTVILELVIYQSLVATCATLVGLFASREWKVGLIHEVSSLFSNVISVLGLPVIPVLAVIFFHEKMDGVKVITMVLAIWGFISYFYQHNLDDSESMAEKRDVKEEISMLPLLKENLYAVAPNDHLYTLPSLASQQLYSWEDYYDKGSKQHDVFSWVLAPSSIYFCTYLRIPVDLQCFLLLTYKFTEVYSFYIQFSSPSHHLLCPDGISNQSTNPTGNSNVNYEIRLFCTVGASAGYGLMLSLTQISFHKVLRRETFTVILELVIYQSLVATCATLVGLFASREWKVGLIHEVSSLFSNVISVLGLPVIPVLVVIFFHEKMDGVKVITMVLAIWGFISYFYQHYLDDSESKAEKRDVKEEISMLPLLKEVTDEQDGLKNIYQKVPLSTKTNFQNYEH